MSDIPEGVTSRVYDQYAYDNEKRRALNWWDGKLQNTLKGKTDNKVVSING